MRYTVHLLTFVLWFIAMNKGLAQDALNMEQVGYWDWPEQLSDVRGAEFNGREYALLGSYTGMSIIDVTDPQNMTEVGWFGGPSSIWRDPFYYNGHAYCVTEGGGGLLIVDMTPLPGSTDLNFTYYTGDNYQINNAHNMFIDENGVAYIFGTNSYQGAIMLDLTHDPMNPVELGVWYEYYTHDGYVRGDTLWAACLQDGVRVIDVSDKLNPVEIGTWTTVGDFAHNIWLSDDGDFAFTTDEITSGFVAAYDVSDLTNVIEVDKINHPLSDEVIPHNTHYIDGWLVTSHYKDGVNVYDVHDPSNMIMTAYFDSSPMEGNGFNGCWGVWPYLGSGKMLVADMSSGFYILDHEYQQASYLEGTVTEVLSGTMLSAVSVDIETAAPISETDIFGEYSTGTANPGLYDVTFNRAGYFPLTVNDVELESGIVTTLDVELVPDTPFAFVGQVVDAVTGDPLSESEVYLDNPFFQIRDTSDANGLISDASFYAGNYTVTAGLWGYQMFCEEVGITSGDTLIIELERGYEDNFDLDLGWTISSTASAGLWERGLPQGTDFDGEDSNPGHDSDDCGFSAFVTGNSGVEAGDDDIDDGYTQLTSPVMDLTSMIHPFVDFDYWFFNDGGNGNPNDEMTVSIDNGDSAVVIATYDESTGGWNSSSILIEAVTAVTDEMRLIVRAADSDPGHLVEAGLDNFRVWDFPNLSVSEVNELTFDVYPNPTNGDQFMISLQGQVYNARLIIRDIAGRVIDDGQILNSGVNHVRSPGLPGIYFVELVTPGAKKVKRLVVQR